MKNVGTYAKAVIGFIVPGIVALVAAAQDASPGGSSITGGEWIGIAAACVLTAGGVYVVPNTHRARTRKGQAGVLYILLVVLVILVILFLLGVIR